MNPLRTFYLVRPPSMIALMAALLTWTAWWLADQYDPSLFGVELAAVPLALLVACTFITYARLPSVVAKLRRISQGGAMAYITVAIVLLTLSYLLTLNDRTAQIVYTCGVGLIGTGHLSFGLYDADTIRRVSSDQTMPITVYSGPYVFSGLGLIGKAVMSALLLDQVSILVWVFAISIGALFYDYLIRWVTILWLVTQPEE